MKKQNSAFYQVFVQGKTSSRPQHLAFNNMWYKILWMVCLATIGSVLASSVYHGGEAIFIWELLIIPPFFRLHELWATPDSDECYKVRGIRGWYWNLYSRMVKHRSVWSHSLILGTPVRFCIGYWIPILTFLTIWNYDLIIYCIETDQIWSIFPFLVLPNFAIEFILYWYAAAMLSDICHLFLDKYNLVEWFLGKNINSYY